jgi:tetratricopeptide (TPR) repeat protein
MTKATAFKILLFILNLSLLNSFSQDTVVIKKELNRALDSAKKGNCNFTRSIARKNISACIKINNEILLAGCYKLLGHCYERETINDSGIYYYKKSLDIYRKKGQVALAGKMHTLLGVVYYNTGNYDPALENFFFAIKLYEPIGDTVGMAWAHNNIGNIYFFQNALDDALKHYLTANSYFDSKGWEDGLAITCGNVGLIYDGKKEYDKASIYYKKAIQLNHDRGIEDAEANNLSNLAALYFRQKKFKEAKELYDEALAINERIKNYYGLSLCYSGLSSLAMENKDYAAAEKYLFRSLEVNKLSGDKQSMIMTLENLGGMYYETGNYKRAYEMLLRHKKLSDSVNTGDKLAEVEARYGKEKREKEIKLLKQENEINELEIKRKQITIYASVVVGILILIIGAFFVRNYLQKKKANKLLQDKNTEILEQKTIIEHKQKEVMDSIHYAKKIQSALIENEEIIYKKFPESFVFFQPKDIVSGDFYFTATNENRFYLAVCDSTGHGVPGAFMSLLNSSFLNEAINEKQIYEPHKVLNYVRERLISSISKDGSQDGMDAILACFEFGANGELKHATYSAANNRPVLVKNAIAYELPADKMPVGKGLVESSFTLHTIECSKNDVLYLYTDGYADQFGGDKGKKFKYNKLNLLLKEISLKSSAEQKDILKTAFDEWKGNLEQIDDVCIIGIKL